MNNEYHLPSEELIIPTGMIMAVHAMADPNRMALVTREKTMTYQELNSRVNQLARALRKRGVMPEDSIAVLLKNRAEFIEVLYANARIGTRFTPINWHLSAAEVGYILDNCDAKVIITEADLKDTCIEALQDNTKAKIKVLIDDTDDAFEAYESLLEGEETSNIDEPIPGKAMLYTSGTTGHPKGVYRKTPPKVNAIQLQLIATGAYNPGNDVFYSPGPLYHSSPLAIGILLHITVGATIIVTQKWDAHEALKLMHKYKVTHINVVPYHMQSLLKLDDDIKKQYNVSHLRWMFHTGAPCPRHIKQDLMAWLGPVIYEMYAGTEGVFTIVSPKEWLEHPGTVGKPDPSVGLTILNDDGEELPAGEIGYIYANTEDLGRFEYYKDEEKTQKTYRGNLFSLGDKGYLDAEGYLYITGRTADLVLS
ncbi:MAG: AMP-binding protein, partial [Coxiellaceae bacterium]|nr:AMP-binding protein [Coxiellaceae bacterium]